MSQDTPCISVCSIEPRSNLCVGCGRTLAEIAIWSSLGTAERRAIMAELRGRMRRAGLTPQGAAHNNSIS